MLARYPKIFRRMNVLLESDRPCLPTSANDCLDSRQEKDGMVSSTENPPDQCHPKKVDNMKTTEEEDEAQVPVNTVNRTQDTPADIPQDRRLNQRTTPQLLATKVLLTTLSFSSVNFSPAD